MSRIPELNPFNSEQLKSLEKLLPTFNDFQNSWLSGFLAQSHAVTEMAQSAATSTKETSLSCVVLFGTESGNTEELADKMVKRLKKEGLKPQLKNMTEISPKSLEKEKLVFVIISTWGDGDPPESAEDFHQKLMKEKAIFSDLSFSVCALGDSSYEQFCQTGKEVDARLEALGAKRILERQDCDVDYDEDFARWLNSVSQICAVQAIQTSNPKSQRVGNESLEKYGKSNPFPAEVTVNQVLNGDCSHKETRHFEISLEGSGFSYEVGDALAVIPSNNSGMVKEFLTRLKLEGQQKVTLKNGEFTLADALTYQLDITALSRRIIEKYQALAQSQDLAKLIAPENKQCLSDYLKGREIIDLVIDFPLAKIDAATLVSLFRKMPPRLYSIASSFKACPDEVHLTVATVRYNTHGRQRNGVASSHLADEAIQGTKVPVYVHPNKNFRLPQETDAPIIMVGPGTGIAPFRAFIQERQFTESKGKNWLFFGEQHYQQDFLYQLEWQDFLENGFINKLNVAFSRDQKKKHYVQDEMIKEAKEIYAWLEQGAYFYICGDATYMAKDVEKALLNLIEKQGNKNPTQAKEYLATLKKQKRYQRDVY